MYIKVKVLLTKLSLYLYDFNPIETSFLFLKSYIRRNGHIADLYNIL